MPQSTLTDTEPVFLSADNLATTINAPQILVIGGGDLGCYIGAHLVKQHQAGVGGLLVSRKPSLLSTNASFLPGFAVPIPAVASAHSAR